MNQKQIERGINKALFLGFIIGMVLTSLILIPFVEIKSEIKEEICHNETIVVGEELIRTYNHTCNLTAVYEKNGFSKKHCLDMTGFEYNFQCKTDYCILITDDGGKLHIRKENFTKEIEVWNPIKIEKEVCQ